MNNLIHIVFTRFSPCQEGALVATNKELPHGFACKLRRYKNVNHGLTISIEPTNCIRNNREKEELIFSSKMVIAGEQTKDFVIDAPVAQVWAIYGTTKLSEIIRAKKFFEDIQIDGDGGVGTFINITPLPGGPVGKYKEKLVKVDHECRIKDADVVEGGYLNLGFTFFRTRFEILENGCNSSVLRVTIFYELKDEYAANASLVNVGDWQGSANAVAEYLAEKEAKSAAC